MKKQEKKICIRVCSFCSLLLLFLAKFYSTNDTHT